MLTITIPVELTSLNDYIDLERTNKFLASSLKKSETKKCMIYALKTMEGTLPTVPLRACFTWYTSDLRTDCDNVAFAKKFILDGLVDAGILPKDSRKYVNGLSDDFFVDKENPRVEVRLTTLE